MGAAVAMLTSSLSAVGLADADDAASLLDSDFEDAVVLHDGGRVFGVVPLLFFGEQAANFLKEAAMGDIFLVLKANAGDDAFFFFDLFADAAAGFLPGLMDDLTVFFLELEDFSTVSFGASTTTTSSFDASSALLPSVGSSSRTLFLVTSTTTISSSSDGSTSIEISAGTSEFVVLTFFGTVDFSAAPSSNETVASSSCTLIASS
mmetsp:Transcript_23876/g.51578  ORF Transcript_23876/g.51578 Transcript_23876/m.51578 type:complete len:205 (-) Transcript_23876:1521-2135(-)